MIRARLKVTTGKRTLAIQTGDITKVPSDAIGNAANSMLAGGGGVNGAIHRAGGPSIMRELDAIRARRGSCPPGDTVVTGAGNLPAQWVLHTVGPRYVDGRSGEAATLRACYRRCLELADELRAETVSLPAISTGAYGYPLEEAAEFAVRETTAILASRATRVRQVTFVLSGNQAFTAFAQATLTCLPTLG